MKLKRFLVLLLAVVLVVGATTIPASAHTYDRAVSITLYNGVDKPNSGYGTLKKDDTSASYINYDTDMNGNDALGPDSFEAIVYGSEYSTTGFTDCTRQTYNNIARTKAIIDKGSEGLIRNDVREIYGARAFGQIYGRPDVDCPVDNGTVVTGKWSVDSIDYGYRYYNSIA